jgi:hypothetical protein
MSSESENKRNDVKVVKITAILADGNPDWEETVEDFIGSLKLKLENCHPRKLITFEGVEMTFSEAIIAVTPQLTKITPNEPKKRGRPKGSKNKPRKSKTAVRTKKAMDDLKDNKRKFTGPMYGWNAKKDGSLVPNWKEQNNIDWMRKQLASGLSAVAVGRKLIAKGITGKKGGMWGSSIVLKVIRNNIHDTRNEDEAPKWFKNRKYSVLKL